MSSTRHSTRSSTAPSRSRSCPATWTPGARLAYVRSFADINIWRIETSGPGVTATSPPVIAISSTRRDGVAALSPDGQRVTFASDRSGEYEMWVANADGSSAVQLTTMAANPGFGRWSPDGKTIAFHSNPEGQAEIFVVPSGGGKPRNLTNHPSTDNFPRFSRDGRWIYFSSTRTGQEMIWKIPAAGGEAVQVSRSNGLLSMESVDGNYLYYVNGTTPDRPGPLVRQSFTERRSRPRLWTASSSTSFAVIDQRGVPHRACARRRQARLLRLCVASIDGGRQQPRGREFRPLSLDRWPRDLLLTHRLIGG